MSLSIAHPSTSRFLGGNKVHLDGNNAHGEGISNANEESQQMDKTGLIKAKDHVTKSLFKLFNGRMRSKLVECSSMVIACSAY